MAKGDSGMGGMFGGGGKPDPRQGGSYQNPGINPRAGGRSVGWNEVGGQQARFDPSGKMPGSLGGTGFMPQDQQGQQGPQRQMSNAGWLGKMAKMGQNVGPGSMDLYKPGMPLPAQGQQLAQKQQQPQNTGAFNFPPMDQGGWTNPGMKPHVMPGYSAQPTAGFQFPM